MTEKDPTADIIRALQAGYGAEDIAVRGVATMAQVQRVVSLLRNTGHLRRVLRGQRA